MEDIVFHQEPQGKIPRQSDSEGGVHCVLSTRSESQGADSGILWLAGANVQGLHGREGKTEAAVASLGKPGVRG